MRVTVVGGGIVGASTSLNLVKAGCQVTVVEKAASMAPAGHGATGNSWAWLNAIKKQPTHYRDLNLAGLALWRTDPEYAALLPHAPPPLEAPAGAPAPGRGPGASGALLIGDARQGHGDIADPAYPHHTLSGVAMEGGVLYPHDAWVDPCATTRALLARAQAMGAQLLMDTCVLQLTTQPCSGSATDAVGGGGGGGAAAPHGQQDAQARLGRPGPGQQAKVSGVIVAPTSEACKDGSPAAAVHIDSDCVVVAAGTACPSLLAGVGFQLPMLHKPAVVATTHPLMERAGGVQRLLHHMLYDGSTWVWQRPDGSFVLGDSHEGEDGSSAAGRELLARAARMVPALAQAQLASVSVGYRPWPQDGFPVVGAVPAVPGLYVAVMHSGMTLAPLVGQLVAREVAAGELAHEWLAPYRPGREMQEGGPQAYAWKKASSAGRV